MVPHEDHIFFLDQIMLITMISTSMISKLATLALASSVMAFNGPPPVGPRDKGDGSVSFPEPNCVGLPNPNCGISDSGRLQPTIY